MLGTYLMLLNDTAPDHITSGLNFNAWPSRVEVGYPIIANPIVEIKTVLV